MEISGISFNVLIIIIGALLLLLVVLSNLRMPGSFYENEKARALLRRKMLDEQETQDVLAQISEAHADMEEKLANPKAS